VLRASKERCYKISLECVRKLKDNFVRVGIYSYEQRFICGDPDGVVQWISREANAFDKILSDRGDFCVFSSARGPHLSWRRLVANILRLWLSQTSPSQLMTSRILKPKLLRSVGNSKIWLKGGREVTDEAIKKNKNESHDASEVARRAEEAAERARLIGTSVIF
jgi:hypothetical protein